MWHDEMFRPNCKTTNRLLLLWARYRETGNRVHFHGCSTKYHRAQCWHAGNLFLLLTKLLPSYILQRLPVLRNNITLGCAHAWRVLCVTLVSKEPFCRQCYQYQLTKLIEETLPCCSFTWLVLDGESELSPPAGKRSLFSPCLMHVPIRNKVCVINIIVDQQSCCTMLSLQILWTQQSSLAWLVYFLKESSQQVSVMFVCQLVS